MENGMENRSVQGNGTVLESFHNYNGSKINISVTNGSVPFVSCLIFCHNISNDLMRLCFDKSDIPRKQQEL